MGHAPFTDFSPGVNFVRSGASESSIVRNRSGKRRGSGLFCPPLGAPVATALALVCSACAGPEGTGPGGSGGGEAGSGGLTTSSGVGAGGSSSGTGGAGGGGSAPQPTILSVGLHVPEVDFIMDNVVCVARRDEPACCWGGSLSGQLGGGAATASYWATPVAELGADVPQIEPGQWFTCARTGAGEVYCWGASWTGALGLGDLGPAMPDVLHPGKLDGIQGAAGLTVGLTSCAWTASGDLFCWGPNGSGQAGDGTTEGPVLSPVKVAGLPPVVSAVSRAEITCALTAEEHVYCWGVNTWGQIGVDTGSPVEPSPVLIPSLVGVVRIAASDTHRCALDSAGAVSCWGEGFGGAPVKLPLSGPARAVQPLAAATCVLLETGDVQCWGATGQGQLGDPTGAPHTTLAEAFTALTGATELWGDSRTACARKDDQSVWCWGLLPVSVEQTFIFTPAVPIPDDFRCDGATVPPLDLADGVAPCGLDCP